MFKVSIPQKDLILNAEKNKNLMDLLVENKLPVASSCLGEGICSKCAMEVSPPGTPSELESKTMTKNKCEPGLRLTCQYLINEDITVKAGYW